MIDIQIVEEERHAGQPAAYKLTIGWSGRSARPSQLPAIEMQPDFDLLFTIQAFSTACEDDLDSQLDFIQGIFGCDEPFPGLPACAAPAAARHPLVANP